VQEFAARVPEEPSATQAAAMLASSVLDLQGEPSLSILF
jgi:hypothetical protein